MTQSEPSPGPSDQSERSAFLDGIEFITGEDPNLGSFLLTIGLVTCVFIALFQFTLPSPVSHLLTAGVIIITVVSAGFAALLDSLGYFDPTSESTAVSESDATSQQPEKRWVPAKSVSASLPPMINFDEELSELQDRFDGTLPDQFTPFIEDYRRLKTNPKNRMTIASDLRADMNPIGAVLEEDTREYELYQRISDGLFRYIGDDADHLTVSDVTSHDTTGDQQSIESLAGELATVDVAVGNDGEAAEVEVVVEFYAGDDLVSTRTASVGTLRPGETEVVSTNVYVPETTDRVEAAARPQTAI